MKMFIPSVGDRIRLLKDWTFPCFCAGGNYKFIWKMRPDTIGHEINSVALTLPKGAELIVQRIYIRAGQKEWDSLTFTLKVLPPPKSKSSKSLKNETTKKIASKATGRFWVKLRDINGIEFEMVTSE